MSIRFRPLREGEGKTSPTGRLPLVLEPNADLSLHELVDWISASRALVSAKLLQHGALLLRGFPVATPDDFESVALALEPGLRERSPFDDSVRSHVTPHTYEGTEVAEGCLLPFHNEDSYLPSIPATIIFGCMVASEKGGETILVDCRDIWQSLPEAVRRWAEASRLTAKIGLPASTVEANCGTPDRKHIQEIAKAYGIEHLSWDGELCALEHNLSLVGRHPRTEEALWLNRYNSMGQWCRLGELFLAIREGDGLRLRTTAAQNALAAVAQTLLDALARKDSRFEYGIRFVGKEPGAREQLQIAKAYWNNVARFAWRRGDVLLVENRLVAHGRLPFRGARRLLVATSAVERTNHGFARNAVAQR